MSGFTLTRIKKSDDGVLGVITYPSGTELCKICERAYTVPHPCIPVGIYTFNLYESPTKGPVWITQDVPGRTNIEIHAGNTENDSLGCLLAGDEFGVINGIPAVLNSRQTMLVLRRVLPDEFDLTIIENFDTIQ